MDDFDLREASPLRRSIKICHFDNYHIQSNGCKMSNLKSRYLYSCLPSNARFT